MTKNWYEKEQRRVNAILKVLRRDVKEQEKYLLEIEKRLNPNPPTHD